MASYDKERGFQREIHNIENAPFRTKFEGVVSKMKGNAAIGCISDMDPQPLLFRSAAGVYAICTVGIINNVADQTKIIAFNAELEAASSGEAGKNFLISPLSVMTASA